MCVSKLVYNLVPTSGESYHRDQGYKEASCFKGTAKNPKKLAHRNCALFQMVDPKTVSKWHQTISSLLRTSSASTSLSPKFPENTPKHQLETDFDLKTSGEKPILFLINPKSGSGRALNVFNSQVGLTR